MPDADLSEFFKLSKPKKPPCQIGLILDGKVTPKLSDGEREQLLAALELDSNIITVSAVSKWLVQRGHDVNNNRVSIHRRNVCSCAGES